MVGLGSGMVWAQFWFAFVLDLKALYLATNQMPRKFSIAKIKASFSVQALNGPQQEKYEKPISFFVLLRYVPFKFVISMPSSEFFVISRDFLGRKVVCKSREFNRVKYLK